MSNYTLLEKIIAIGLTRSPRLKYRLKYIYQKLNYFIFKKKYSYKLNYDLKELDKSAYETFFGYYDKSPENKSGTFIVYHRTNQDTSLPTSPSDYIEIVIKSLITNSERVVDRSYSYNWQQGCRTMWISDSEIVYNMYCIEKDDYFARVYCIDNNSYRDLPCAISDCYKNQFAICIDYDRFRKYALDYCYQNRRGPENKNSIKSNELLRICLKTGNKEILLSIDDLKNFKPNLTMVNAFHTINHIMINSSGDKSIFIHRWYSSSGRRYDRLITFDLVTRLLDAPDEIIGVSHCFWRNDNIIDGYLNVSGKWGYYSIDCRSGTVTMLFEKLKLLGDGHLNYGSKYVIDSYPDRSRMKSLYLFDLENDELQIVGQFLEPLKFYGISRCDLHPRWNLKKIKFI